MSFSFFLHMKSLFSSLFAKKFFYRPIMSYENLCLLTIFFRLCASCAVNGITTEQPSWKLTIQTRLAYVLKYDDKMMSTFHSIENYDLKYRLIFSNLRYMSITNCLSVSFWISRCNRRS